MKIPAINAAISSACSFTFSITLISSRLDYSISIPPDNENQYQNLYKIALF